MYLNYVYKLISYHRVNTHNEQCKGQLATALWEAVPWLRRVVDDFTPWRPEFDSGLLYTGFMEGKMALG
jgi:hypothetical protein